MLLPVTSAGWRLQGVEEPFELTRALRPQSHIELNWMEGASDAPLTEVWVALYFTTDEPLQKLLVHQMDARVLEWRFTFEGGYYPLVVALDWNGVDEDAREITLLNDGVPRDLLNEMKAGREV